MTRSHARHRALALAFVGATLAACAGSGSQVAPEPTPWSPRTLFPMTEGSAWSYDVDAGDGDPVLAVTRVVTATPSAAVLQVGQEQTAYELRPDGWYRPAKGGYLLKTPLREGASWPSGGGLTATLVRTVERIETPAGRFERCAEIEETHAVSGNRIWTTYCPRVGPVRVVSEMLVRGHTLRVTAVLRGYALGSGSASN